MRNSRILSLLLPILLTTASTIGQTPPATFTGTTAASQVQSTGLASDGVTVIGYDALGRPITSSGPDAQLAFSHPADTRMDQYVDRFGNRVLNVITPQGLTASAVDTLSTPPWSSVYVTDAEGKVVLYGVDWESTAVNAFAAELGIPLGFPDWVQVAFNGPKTISEVRFYTVQDNYPAPVEPTAALRFANYGVTDFEVQYWYDAPDVKKWVVVPDGVIVNNRNVMRTVQFPAVTTTKVRVVIKNALYLYSRVTELEAFTTSGVNAALAANGGVASASTTLNASYPVISINNGDRKGLSWGAGGGWADGTPDNAKLPAATVTPSEDPYTRKVVYQNAFAKVTQSFNKTAPPLNLPPSGQPYQFGNEVTEVKGKIFQASLNKTNRGIEIWDNQGGAQLFGHDGSNRLFWVADANDYLVRIARDAQGRIIRIYLGETGLLRFFYDDKGLVAKEFIDRPTSKRIYRFDRPETERTTFPRTREALQAVLPGVGTIAEYDKTVDDRGLVVAHLLNQPYALIPFQHTGPIYNWHMPVRWIINLPPSDNAADLIDRIEYNDDEIIVRLSTWREMPGAARHVVAISMPRSLNSDMPQTFRPASSQEPNVPGLMLAVSAGSSEGNEPDNDDLPTCQTDMCITVVGEPWPDLPPFTNWPTSPNGGGGGGGAGGGNANPFNSNLTPTQHSKMLKAKADAEKVLAEKPQCAALFQNLTNKPKSNRVTPDWTRVHIYNIANGSGVKANNSNARPCDSSNVLMWMNGIKQSTLYVCPRAETEDPLTLRDAFIHELLHTAGLRENTSTHVDLSATMSHGEISAAVAGACR